jgi:hypothetical protein
MKRTYLCVLLLAGSALAVAGCKEANAPAAGNEAAANASSNTAAPSDPIQSAEAAAPASIAHNAAVITVDANGAMKTLREGTNGWTCMPDNPQTPGHDPMCMDGNALKWAQAWMGHKDPPAGAVGMMYMLAGGSDASNTDPWGAKPAEGQQWLETGPHVMVVGSKEILTGYPAGDKPDTKAPYVMFSGTPYAHLMVPVG